MLYKIIDDIPTPFNGKFIEFDGKIYANPKEEHLRMAGYKTPEELGITLEEENDEIYDEDYTESDE